MGRPRKEIKRKREATGDVAIFRHPLRGKAVRISLGDGDSVRENLRALNRIFLDEKHWVNPPHDNEFIRDEWLRLAVQSGEQVEHGESVEKLREELQRTQELLRVAIEDRDEAKNTVRLQRKQLEDLLGRKYKTSPFASLEAALSDWKTRYTGRDEDHAKNVAWVLGMFVAHFGKTLPVDMLEGREADIEQWLRDLKVRAGKRKGTALSAGVRQQYRRYVLRFLKNSGIGIDSHLISNPKRHEVRRDRGAIDWLDERTAFRVGQQLPEYWADFWRVQLLTGMRPTEQVTLQRSNFRGNMLTLAALNHLTLKMGSRTIRVPEVAMKIIRRRLHAGDLVFPHVPHAQWVKRAEDTARGPWLSENAFTERYRRALRAVPGMPFVLDTRTARRTFASTQLRKGGDVEHLAKYMGTSAAVLREHYAAILPQEVRLKKVRV